MTHARPWTRYAATLLATTALGAAYAVAGPALGASAAVPAHRSSPAPGPSPATAPNATSTTARGTAPRTAAPLSNAAFIALLAPGAREARRTTGIPASVMMAQAILESGWGRSALAAKQHNYFGIKCWGGPGLYGNGCVDYSTQEYTGGTYVASLESFRSYPNAAASLQDYTRFLRQNSRYRTALSVTKNPDQFIREVHKAGYATDPRYADTVIRLMRQYNLYRFDR